MYSYSVLKIKMLISLDKELTSRKNSFILLIVLKIIVNCLVVKAFGKKSNLMVRPIYKVKFSLIDPVNFLFQNSSSSSYVEIFPIFWSMFNRIFSSLLIISISLDCDTKFPFLLTSTNTYSFHSSSPSWTKSKIISKFTVKIDKFS